METGNKSKELSDYDDFFCPLCDKRGLVSFLQVRYGYHVIKGVLKHLSKFYLWEIETEIKLRENKTEFEDIYKTSLTCGCERGEAYHEARNGTPQMIPYHKYEEYLAKANRT